MKEYTNSKSETLNTKQAQITQIQNPKQKNFSFEHLNLEFRYCLVFRILKLGFNRNVAMFILFSFLFAYGITIHRDTLSNGLVVLTVEVHKIPLVEMKVMVRAGSVFDPQGKEGLANLTNQLLILGTKTRLGDEIAESIESVGGEFLPFTTEDYAGLTAKVLSKDLNLLIDITSDCLQNPLLDSVELIRLKQEIVSKIKASQDDPFQISEEGFRKLVFKEHPLNHLPVGFDSTVARVSSFDILNFYARYYSPNNTFIVFVGDFEKDSLLVLLEKKFSTWQRKNLLNPEITRPIQSENRVGKIIKKEISQAYILFGFFGPGYSAKDWISARLMNYILGGAGLTSRISNKIREEKGLAYSAYSFFNRFADGGYYVAEVQTKKEMASEVVRILVDEITKMQEGRDINGTKAPTPIKKELEQAKKYYIGHFPLIYDTYREMKEFIAQIEIEQLGLDYPSKFEGLISAVTINDLKASAQKYLHPEAFYLLIVGDINKEEIKVEGIEWME